MKITVKGKNPGPKVSIAKNGENVVVDSEVVASAPAPTTPAEEPKE